MTFAAQYQFGKIGEGTIATWLRQREWNVLPVYEKELDEGKGPVLFTAQMGTSLIAPDLLCFRGKEVYWIEAKTKSSFTWHRITGRWVTGIDLRHYGDYLKVARLSPFPVWLLFLHLEGQAKDTPEGMETPTGLFGRELVYLEQHENHRHDNWGRSGMVYWALESLHKLAALDEMIPEVAF